MHVKIFGRHEVGLTLATLYCRLLAMYSSTEPGCLELISPALNLSSRALFKGMVPVTWMLDIAARFALDASSLASWGIIENTAWVPTRFGCVGQHFGSELSKLPRKT